MKRGLLLLSLLFGAAAARAASYEATFPIMQGGDDAGFFAVVFSNRDTAGPVSVAVDLTASDRDSAATYVFAGSTITVDAAQLNAVTGELAQDGSQMVHFDLKKAGFKRLKNISARVRPLTPATAAPPVFSWASFVTGRKGSRVLSYSDYRAYKVFP